MMKLKNYTYFVELTVEVTAQSEEEAMDKVEAMMPVEPTLIDLAEEPSEIDMDLYWCDIFHDESKI